MRRTIICIMFAGTLAAAAVAASGASAASTFQITGGGNGHGVGMSQYGALGYAQHGDDYRVILEHYYEGTALGTTDPGQVVRVLIATGGASFSGATRTGGKRLTSGQTYSVRPARGGSLVLYGPSGEKVGHFSSPMTVTGPGQLSLGGHGLYRGALEFRAVGRKVQTVNAVGLDDYVRGVISAEMPASWPAQALEAQAVAARTYAITSDVAGNGYQLYPDTRSQMYKGVSAETSSTEAAVAATRGQIVTYNGAPAITYFFASSGGYTEDIQNVWLGDAPEPWLRGISDPYDDAGANPYHRWSYRMTIAAAKTKLGRLVKGRLLGVEATKRGVSPRVVSAQVVGTRGRTNVTGAQLQAIFSLASTYMSFTTISSAPGSVPSAPAPSGPSTGGAAAQIRHILLALWGVDSAAPAGVHGNVFPAWPGARAAVQVQTKKGWRTVRRIRLGAHGAYSIQLSRHGSYRLLFRGVAGPPVTTG